MNNGLWSCWFVDVNTGWAVGDDPLIMKTTNGGNYWSVQQSNLSVELYSVQFIDSLFGWICGEGGTLLKTTNGGVTWVQKPSGVVENINSLYFLSASNGFAITGDWNSYPYPYSGRILKTTNAVSYTHLNRSFSTKAKKGRGIGTYSVKLLIENYLRGRVSFISNEEEQTKFIVEIPKVFPETEQ